MRMRMCTPGIPCVVRGSSPAPLASSGTELRSETHCALHNAQRRGKPQATRETSPERYAAIRGRYPAAIGGGDRAVPEQRLGAMHAATHAATRWGNPQRGNDDYPVAATVSARSPHGEVSLSLFAGSLSPTPRATQNNAATPTPTPTTSTSTSAFHPSGNANACSASPASRATRKSRAPYTAPLSRCMHCDHCAQSACRAGKGSVAHLLASNCCAHCSDSCCMAERSARHRATRSLCAMCRA